MYTKTPWNNGATPPINDVNLNKMEQGIYDAHAKADANEADIASNYADLNARVSSNDVDIAQNKEDISKNKNDIASLLAGEVMKGAWTPTAGSEYPTASVNWSYYISGVNENGYTFTSGDLTGKVAKNMDKIILTASGWSLIENNLTVSIPNGAIGRIISPLLDLPLKNSLAMKAGVGSTTFTRASTATYIDRYGVLKSASIDEPRFERDGFLVEGTSTNIALQSSNISISHAITGATPEIDVDTAPDETITADRLVEDTSTGFHYISQTYSISAGTAYTASRFFPKSSTETSIKFELWNATDLSFYVVFNPQDGSVISSNTYYRVEDFGTYLRVQVTAMPTITTIACRTFLGGGSQYTGDGSTYISMWGLQVEPLLFATSYMPTTTAQVTRSADICYLDFYNNKTKWADINSLSAEVSLLGLTHTLNRMIIGTGALSDGYLNISLSGGVAYSAAAGDASIISNTDTKFSVIGTCDGTTMHIYKNGIISPDTGTVGVSAEVNPRITIGNTSLNSNFMYGHISNIKVYDIELTATEAALAGGKTL